MLFFLIDFIYIDDIIGVIFEFIGEVNFGRVFCIFLRERGLRYFIFG